MFGKVSNQIKENIHYKHECKKNNFTLICVVKITVKLLSTRNHFDVTFVSYILRSGSITNAKLIEQYLKRISVV